ncbi:hypothetical protein EIN_422060 [Entamoeba invadens IP1]|uniref:DOCKER domain-containing protein n=1 Tax=Entamoeba invadens IP1 TaxID=370355 RepID=A0A0A1UA22_ENTIV|nr:hypothetical protein EIN_422060 [Entamoeba invadens IP1]ELP91827.1 hypothetical protein EIN_422060 [Entamoeba invadens IP1]|eukprot:XP_004258598.1 hypothetical protein EIN_422060 [Entamoeba invadens IP1]
MTTKNTFETPGATNDGNENFICVASVSACSPDKKIVDKFLSTNIFASEISYNPTGGKMDELSKVCKKRTVIITKKSLPSVLEREPVVSTEEVTLTPIQSNTDDIEKQIEKVASLIESTSTNTGKISQLQRQLMGILCANVNGGVLAVCNTFFTKENIKNFGQNDVKNLYDSILRVVDLCKTGLRLHKSFMKIEFSRLQNVMELGLVNIERTLRECGVIIDAYMQGETEPNQEEPEQPEQQEHPVN